MLDRICVIGGFLCIIALLALGAAANADDGTYYGQLRHGTGWHEVTTTFVTSANGDKSGSYRIADGTNGHLRYLGTYGHGQVGHVKLKQHLYEWTDNGGKGLLKVVFKGDRFDGYWHTPGTNDPSARWNGHKPQTTPQTPATHQSYTHYR